MKFILVFDHEHLDSLNSIAQMFNSVTLNYAQKRIVLEAISDRNPIELNSQLIRLAESDTPFSIQLTLFSLEGQTTLTFNFCECKNHAYKINEIEKGRSQDTHTIDIEYKFVDELRDYVDDEDLVQESEAKLALVK